ncbi:aldo/keto reductase [Alteromonas pelagimontana]|nr:aldo/keto reductase [Alteromonas pelagimontana]
MRTLKLCDGRSMPQIGFGTAAIGEFQQDNEFVKDTVLKAIEMGYRHIDTAALYGNERSVGQAIAESGIPRKEFFVTTKVWDTQQGHENTLQAMEESLNRLNMDYVDLYLVHWPYPEKTQATWQAMEQLHREGRARSLGLSNFRKSDIQQLMGFAEIKPVYNQLELHPYLTQKALVEYCESKGMVVSCWSPLGSGSWSGVDNSEKPISDPVITKLAEKYGVSAGQIILAWDLQQGRIVIPKAESEKHMKGNLNYGFTLTDEELTAIDNLNKNHRFGDDPDTATESNLSRPVPN